MTRAPVGGTEPETVTANSRTTTTSVAHAGMRPCSVNQTSAANRDLVARGSMNFSEIGDWSRLLAIWPSTKSVRLATAKIASPI